MTNQEIATEAVKMLAPALPLITNTLSGAGKKIGEKLGDVAIDQAKSIWNWLSPKAERHLALKDAISDVAKQPGDSDSIASLRLQLRKMIDAQPDLVSELKSLIGPVAMQSNNTIASGAGAIAISGAVSGSSVETHITK